MVVGGEKVSTLLAQAYACGCKSLTLRGVIFVERDAWGVRSYQGYQSSHS